MEGKEVKVSTHKISSQDMLQPWFKCYTHCKIWRRHYKQVHKQYIKSGKYWAHDKKDLEFWKQEVKISRENYRNSCEYAKRKFDETGTTTIMNEETSTETQGTNTEKSTRWMPVEKNLPDAIQSISNNNSIEHPGITESMTDKEEENEADNIATTQQQLDH